MDIQTLLHNLHEEVSCSVCMTKFTDPKQLPCLHSFCLHCLQGIQRTSGIRENISCPECRQNFRIPGDGDLNTLPTNFRINSLLDVLAIKECNTSGVKCGNCDKRSGESYYCFQCCFFWCDYCIGLHNGITANKEHHALALKDFQDRDFENILKRPVFCGRPGHEKKELEFFCMSCEVVICYSCTATLHEGHPKIVLEEGANEKKMKVESAIEFEEQILLEKINKIVELQDDSVNIKAQLEREKRKAQEFANKMIAAIEENKKEIILALEKKGNEVLDRLKIKLHEKEDQAKVIEETIAKKKTLLKRSTKFDILRLDISFPEGVVDEEEQLDRDIEGLRHVRFVENGTLMHKTNSEGIGTFRTCLNQTKADQSCAKEKGISEATVGLEAQIVVTTKNTQGEQCYEERDYVTVEIANRQGHNCATETQVQDKKDGTYKISYFAKETGKSQASVKVNGEHVRGSPFDVQVKPRQFKPVLSFGQKGWFAGMLSSPSPWGVAVNEKNEIGVTEIGNHKIQVFSSNGTHLRSFGRKGDQQVQFDWPRGIAFHNDNIIVADSSNHRVQLFSDQGEYLGQFGGKGNLDHQLKNPHGLSIDSDGNIIVADSGNELIKIFLHSGQCVRKIGTAGFLLDPIHCIHYENSFIVSDKGDHCIKVFDGEGYFMQSFGKEGDGDGEFNEPCCLVVNKARQLMVCDKMNHRIQVFELSGKFVTKFGAKGSNAGQFNCPLSAAVLSDGRIVVSDFSNNRVQIFE